MKAVFWDTCGTGGDGKNTFNISTTVAFVVAAAGVTVAKHGNRAVSSGSGSADVLAALGVKIDVPKEMVERCLREVGLGFLFAPLLHGAMKYAAAPRREVGIRTIFNLLGPLTNPAGASHQLIGIYDGTLIETVAQVLGNLGSARAMVVHGEEGLDEISLGGPTAVAEWKDGAVTCYTLHPEEFGFEKCPAERLTASDPEECAAIVTAVLKGEPGPARDVVLINSGAALCVSERVATIGRRHRPGSGTNRRGGRAGQAPTPHPAHQRGVTAGYREPEPYEHEGVGAGFKPARARTAL